MRYVTVVVRPAADAAQWSRNQAEHGDDVNPNEIWLDGTYVATQEAIQYVNLLDDGTAIGVGQFSGDADRLTTIENEVPEIISCTVTGGESWLAYMHYEPHEFERTLLELVDTEAISIDWPMRETADGLEITLMGDEAALKKMIAGIPDGMGLVLKRVGDYQPEIDLPTAEVTDRQKEVLRTAIALGYYDIPRRASQRDLATEIGLSRGTIGEHLRRAEAKIIRSVVL